MVWPVPWCMVLVEKDLFLRLVALVLLEGGLLWLLLVLLPLLLVMAQSLVGQTIFLAEMDPEVPTVSPLLTSFIGCFEAELFLVFD